MQRSKDKKDLPEEITIDNYSEGKVTGAVFFDIRREKKGGLYPVKFRVTYQRKHKYFDFGYSLSVGDWKSLPNTRNLQLKETRKLIFDENQEIHKYVADLVRADKFSFETLYVKIKKGDHSSVDNAFNEKISKLKDNGQVGTAGIYECALNSLSTFNNNREIRFLTVNGDWLKRYEKWFVGDDKNSYATLSIYLRCLRAIFNEAIRSQSCPNSAYPFGRGKYEIPTSPGRKMALSIQQIKTIVDYKTEPGTLTEKLRDLWLFCYMANGMNIKDLVCLKWKNIEGDEIVYHREKTKHTSREKKAIVVPVLAEMWTIIEKWGNTEKLTEGFVFGYLNEKTNNPADIRIITQNLTRQMNKHMKKIAEAAGLPHISTYTARHSFSTILLRSGANVEFISEALGHSSIETTKAYLAGFETEARRKMNANLLNFKSGNDGNIDPDTQNNED